WRDHHEAILRAAKVVMEVNEDYGRTFDRKYGNGLVEKYRCEGAEAVIVAMGSMVGTARTAVDKLRDEGENVGLVKLKCFLPFPEEDFRRIGESVKAVGMIDRNVCLGHGGAGFRMVRHSLYELDDRPAVLQFHAGLGGKEVRVRDIVKVGEKTLKAARGEKVAPLVEWV
ncbi:MAG: pyruvate ferredoxin oxidoreductase, partial [Candidatus Bathyarchaeota archaeon]